MRNRSIWFLISTYSKHAKEDILYLLSFPATQTFLLRSFFFSVSFLPLFSSAPSPCLPYAPAIHSDILSLIARSWWLVVPSLQIAHSDHLLMTGEQRKAFPAAAAWHPAQCANTHTNKYEHTGVTQWLARMQKLRDSYSVTRKNTCKEHFLRPLFGGVTCLCIALLLSSVILCCTFAPSPSLHLFLPASSSFFHLLLWCYWLCHTGTDRNRGVGVEWGGGQCVKS